MTESILGGIKRDTGWSIVLGVLIIVLGIVAMMAPLVAGVVAVYIIAWSAIFGGVAQVVYAIRTHEGGHTFLEVILGLVYIVAGFFLLGHPLGGLLALTLLLGSLLVVYGIFALVLAFHLRPLKPWGWILFDAIITILLGVMIWAHWPVNAEWVVGTLFGISIFFSGITRLMVSMGVRRLAEGKV
ncbi:MAG: DUF308 domain-containing protein [Candidatus Korobacteraceae bacterium]|jgi:uncharacterized membrane protein HdeD (DUF308 family)